MGIIERLDANFKATLLKNVASPTISGHEKL
jgi:hypothetical protein